MTLEDRGARALDDLAARAEKKPRRKKQPRPTEHDAGVLFDPNGKMVIRHDPGRLPEILDQLGQALAGHGGLFAYSGRLVRVYETPATSVGGVHRPHGALILHAVDVPHLSEIATRAAVHERYDARSESYRRCDCPRRVAEAYLSRGSWPELPTLVGVIQAPLVTPDGRLISDPGLDPETGIFYAPGPMPGWAPPPANPSRADAQTAIDGLLDLVQAFPFVSAADHAAFVAGIIGALLRRVLPSSPITGLTAPQPGTGKSLLSETIALLATGRRASVVSLGLDDAEAEKRLGGMLLAGDPVITIDNIERPLKGDLLCQVATQQFVRLRPLGVSGMLSIPTTATICANGNNLSIVGDLKRRVLLIRLDSGLERPERRHFTRDHLADVLARRGELIRHALVVVLAYLQAGAPAIDDLPPLGGFETWDRMVRRPLCWLGLPDPLRPAEGLREEDSDLQAMRMLLTAWHAAFGIDPVPASEVVRSANEWQAHSETYANPGLHEAMQTICFEKPTSRKLGNWLRQHRGRVIDGFRIEQGGADPHSKVALWRVVPC
jgi:putative DNA primase/helicase